MLTNAPLAMAFLIAATLLAGCGSLIDLEAFQTETRLFTLRPNIGVSGGPDVGHSLLVDEPVASGAIDGLRVAVMVSPTEISFASTASWESRPAQLIHQLLSDTFEAAGRLSGVTTVGSVSGDGFRLRTELREFHVVFVDPGRARIVVTLKGALFAAGDRFQAFERTFSADESISSRDLDAIISAFNRASGQVVEELVGWALTSLGQVTVQ